jgi:hypothetical protein
MTGNGLVISITAVPPARSRANGELATEQSKMACPVRAASQMKGGDSMIAADMDADKRAGIGLSDA